MARTIRARRNRRVAHLMHDISLTPLIDMALTLLIIFMVTAPMMNSVIHIDLPKGHVKEEITTRPDLIVSVDNKKKLFFNNEPVTDIATLIKSIDKQMGTEKRTVFICADRVVAWGEVAELAGAMMKGGIEHVAFATTSV